MAAPRLETPSAPDADAGTAVESSTGNQTNTALEHALKEEIVRLESELNVREEAYEQKIKTLEQKASKGPGWAEMDDLELENLALKREIKDQLTSRDAERPLREEMSKVERELAGVRAMLSGRHERVAELEGEIESMRARETRVKEDNLRLEKEKAVLERENGGLIAGQARLRNELETARAETPWPASSGSETKSDDRQSDACRGPAPQGQPTARSLFEELEVSGQSSRRPSSSGSVVPDLWGQKNELHREIEQLRRHINCLQIMERARSDYNKHLEQNKHFLEGVDEKVLEIARLLLKDRTVEEAKAFLKRRRLCDDHVRQLWQEVDKVRLESTTLARAKEAATKRVQELEERLGEAERKEKRAEPEEPATEDWHAEYERLESMIDAMPKRGRAARLDKFLAEQDQRKRNAEIAEREGQRMLDGERAVDMAAIAAIYAYGLPAEE